MGKRFRSRIISLFILLNTEDIVLVDDAGSIVFPGLGDRVDGHTAHLVGGAPEGVVGDDCCRDCGKRGGVRNRGGQSADGTLGDALLDKVCHFADAPALDWRAGSR